MIKSRRMRCAGHLARIGAKRNTYMILMGKPEGKRPLGRPRRRWVDNTKMDIREIGWGGIDSIDLVQDKDQSRAFVNTAMNLGGSINIALFLNSCTTGGFPRRAPFHEVG
jgi:hypothetical protein